MTRRRTTAIGLALCVAACGSDGGDAPVAPTSTSQAVLSGVVRGTATGARIPGAEVAILTGQAAGRAVKTTAEGEYRFENVPPGRLTVWAAADRHLPAEASIDFAGTGTANLTLPSLVALTGLVVDLDTGAPIAGATVRTLLGNGAFGPESTTSDERGTYRFESLVAGSRNVSAAAPGYQEWRAGTNVNGINTLNFQMRPLPMRELFTGTAGGTAHVIPFTLRRAGAIDVTITWPGAASAIAVRLYVFLGPTELLLEERRAPSGGPARIAFSRSPLGASTGYELRIVNLESGTQIPFTLELTRWD